MYPQELIEQVRKNWESEGKDLPVTSINPKFCIPSKFKTYTPAELKQKGLIKDLIIAYQNIFGDSDIWEEGAFCNREGWSNTISLSEYEKRKYESRLKCECGGVFQPCYPTEILEARLTDELSNSHKSVLITMEGDEKFKIAGFLWGTIAKFDDIEQRIINTRYRGRAEDGLVEINKLKFHLKERNLINGDFLYGDEMGILKEFRVGLNQLFLIRAWCEWGNKNKVNKILFWTSKKSPLFLLAFAYGCELIHSTRDGLEFLLHPNFEPGLRVAQNFDDRQLMELMSKNITLLNQK